MVVVMMTMVVLSSAVCPSKLEEPHFLLYLEWSLEHMDYEFSWLCWFPSQGQALFCVICALHVQCKFVSHTCASWAGWCSMCFPLLYIFSSQQLHQVFPLQGFRNKHREGQQLSQGHTSSRNQSQTTNSQLILLQGPSPQCMLHLISPPVSTACFLINQYICVRKYFETGSNVTQVDPLTHYIA